MSAHEKFDSVEGNDHPDVGVRFKPDEVQSTLVDDKVFVIDPLEIDRN